MAEREEISRGVAAGEPCRQIAARLGRAQRPKPAKLVLEPRLRAVVEASWPALVAGADRRVAAVGLPF